MGMMEKIVSPVIMAAFAHTAIADVFVGNGVTVVTEGKITVNERNTPRTTEFKRKWTTSDNGRAFSARVSSEYELSRELYVEYVSGNCDNPSIRMNINPNVSLNISNMFQERVTTAHLQIGSRTFLPRIIYRSKQQAELLFFPSTEFINALKTGVKVETNLLGNLSLRGSQKAIEWAETSCRAASK